MGSNPVVALLLALGIIILAARLAGTLARMVGQPRVLGELLVGVLLGPTLLNMAEWGIFHGVHIEDPIKELAEIGVVLLMFLVGLEVDLDELRKVGKVAVFAGIGGGLLPVLMTIPVGLIFGVMLEPALFAGVTLAATSVSISAQVLLELGVLQTKEGNALLATALVDDVLAILLVSLATALTAAGSVSEGSAGSSVLIVLIRMIGFFVIGGLLAWFVLPRILNWISRQPLLSQSYGIAAFGIVAALIFAGLAEELGGVAAITGAFLAGVGLSRCREKVKHEVESAASSIAYGFLVPVFFVSVGFASNLRTFNADAIPLTVALMIVAVLSKLIGCGGGGLLGGFNRAESLRLGVCMISRGEVGLIIIAVAVNAGMIELGSSLYNALFVTILLTTLITPPLVRKVFPRDHEAAQISSEGAHS
jgi:Kef-type K+ transport system membrane component KefB